MTTDQDPTHDDDADEPDVPSDPKAGGGSGSAHNATIKVEENE